MFLKLVRYSTPRRVEEITLIKDVTACYKEEFFIQRIFHNILKLLSDSIQKMSFLINSYTKFFLNSGAIYKALTLKDKNTSTRLSTLFSFKLLRNFFLCSYITDSANKSFPSNLPSFMTTLWYFPNWILKLSRRSRTCSLYITSLTCIIFCIKLIETLKMDLAPCMISFYFLRISLSAFSLFNSFLEGL